MILRFLKSTYSLSSPKDTQAHYDKWAGSYDEELTENGYATPDRLALALWEIRPDGQMPVLDFGCGTGLSGLALRRAGFQVLDGMDPTPGMLEAAQDKGIYRTLSGFDITAAPPIPQGAYRAITAIGVIGQGAAPPETIDHLLRALPKGGVLGFSLNDIALADRAYIGRLNDWLDMGAARLLARNSGPHLPGIDLNSDIFIVEKA
ncbi:class I SAM-dependent DNA methyltransferase [Ruegeria marina]|uniref:Methyltransferase domain-containing protein n=1 Tax=Ruegeria marina TaxID=639004 RepID=A0A1G6JA20_9RHOB|nr:methyltransferase domain-containing protein [Ruegeria marina]SDC15590.1 Methyltransferase domain-containing protein [Ruegeria marina]